MAAALLETVHKYRGISAIPLGYLQRTLKASDIPVATLLSCILYTTLELDARTLDSVAACVFELPAAQVETAIQAAVTSRPARLGQGNTQGYVRLFRRCINLSKDGSNNGHKLIADVLESLDKATPDNTTGVQEVAQTVLKESVESVATISETVIQAIRKIAGDFGLGNHAHDDPMTAAGRGLDDVRPATPDPLAETFDNGSTNGKVYNHIKTPVYITYALQNALEQTWTWQSSRRSDSTHGEDVDEGENDFRNFPVAYRDLIHLGPILTSNPSTFLHSLLQASFERVFSSLRDLRQGAKRDIETSVNPEDQITVDLSIGTEPSERDRIAARIVKVGWNDMIWLFHYLVVSLRYWQRLSAEGREGSDWHRDWPYPVGISKHMWHFPMHSSAQSGNSRSVAQNHQRSISAPIGRAGSRIEGVRPRRH
jgi:hypothetical protein